jgi:hypothetical protein
VRQPLEARSWVARGGQALRDSAAVQPGSTNARWDTELTVRVHLIERDEREHDQLEKREPKRKHISAETPSTHGPEGPVRKASAYGGREADGTGWAKGQVGR